MLEASRKEIKNFAKLLRKKLVQDGCHQKYINSLSDDQVLDDFRTCCDCGDEIHSRDQQIHIILESDTAERAFELLYEQSEPEEHESSEIDDCLILYNEHNSLEDEEAHNKDEVILRGKWIFDDASTIDEAIECLDIFKRYLQHLKQNGYELLGAVEDDYGFLRRK